MQETIAGICQLQSHSDCSDSPNTTPNKSLTTPLSCRVQDDLSQIAIQVSEATLSRWYSLQIRIIDKEPQRLVDMGFYQAVEILFRV